MNQKSSIYIGTSGWSYKHWRDLYYPKTIQPKNYLTQLARDFNCTEINTSFYRLPAMATLDHWISQAPAEFKFCPKMSRYLTQMKKLNDPDEPLARFFGLFAPIKKHLGPILFQLPPNLGFHLDKVIYLLDILKANYRGFKFAIEARHPSWFDAKPISLLKKYAISFVIADSGGRFPSDEKVTARDIYIRFHGPDGSYATSYPTAALEVYAQKCKRWATQGHRIWIFFNNDLHAYAIDNARTLQSLLAGII